MIDLRLDRLIRVLKILDICIHFLPTDSDPSINTASSHVLAHLPLSYIYPLHHHFQYQILQFILLFGGTQIRHTHDLNYQTRPSREVLRPLAFPCFGVILLPRETCLFPTLINSFDKILSQVGIQCLSACLLRSFLLCQILYDIVSILRRYKR